VFPFLRQDKDYGRLCILGRVGDSDS
jgi:hypothetical protein